MTEPLEDDEYYVRVCQALALHSLSHGGELTIPASPENLGYSLAFHEDGSLTVHAIIHPGRPLNPSEGL